MATFKVQAAEWTRLDWQLLQDGAISLFYRSRVLAAALEWFRANSYHVYDLDCESWQSGSDLYDALSTTLHFPGYFGRNLNALYDVLGDLDVPADGGAALVFRHYDAFVQRDPEIAQALLDVVERTSRRFLLTGRRFLALVQSDDPRIAFAPVGAASVAWNPREWQMKDRGLEHPAPLREEAEQVGGHNGPAPAAGVAEFTACNERGNAYFWQKQYPQALREYDHALQLQPDDPATLAMRANTYDALGQPDAAIADYSRAVEAPAADPAARYVALLNRATAYRTLGRAADALADYARALELRPDDPAVLAERGTLYSEGARYEDALADFARALRLDPDNLSTRVSQGQAYAALGRYREALAAYDAALHRRPGDPELLQHLTAMHARLVGALSEPGTGAATPPARHVPATKTG